MLIAERHDEEVRTVERAKEKVQLGADLSDGKLSADGMARGLSSLARFEQRLRGIDRRRIAAVGTCALRQSANRAAFIERARDLLALDLRVISGEEEAELIFFGASHIFGRFTPRLVLDIGGGSSELAIGEGFRPDWVASRDIGCVALRDRCFKGAADPAHGYRAAREAALSGLADVRLPGPVPSRVLGTSGTVESVQSVLSANGLASGTITRAGLDELESAVLDRRWAADAGMPGLAPERVDIFPAGLAILAAAFECFALDEMTFVEGSLQDGLLYALMGIGEHDDIRHRAVVGLARRFDTDPAQAARVLRTALELLEGVRHDWGLTNAPSVALLEWAATLHEVGRAVNARHYHRHGAYIVKSGELHGFTQREQYLLGLLVRGHRRSFPALSFGSVEPEIRDPLIRMCVLLRLAVILERSRSDGDSPGVRLAVRGERLSLALTPGWLERHPLSARELDVEAGQLDTVGLTLAVSDA